MSQGIAGGIYGQVNETLTRYVDQTLYENRSAMYTSMAPKGILATDKFGFIGAGAMKNVTNAHSFSIFIGDILLSPSSMLNDGQPVWDQKEGGVVTATLDLQKFRVVHHCPILTSCNVLAVNRFSGISNEDYTPVYTVANNSNKVLSVSDLGISNRINDTMCDLSASDDVEMWVPEPPMDPATGQITDFDWILNSKFAFDGKVSGASARHALKFIPNRRTIPLRKRNTSLYTKESSLALELLRCSYDTLMDSTVLESSSNKFISFLASFFSLMSNDAKAQFTTLALNPLNEAAITAAHTEITKSINDAMNKAAGDAQRIALVRTAQQFSQACVLVNTYKNAVVIGKCEEHSPKGAPMRLKIAEGVAR